MSKDKQESEDVKKKKKRGPIFRLFRFIIGLFFIVLILAIALVIYLAVNIVSSDNFTGNEMVERIKNENESLETVSNDIMYDSFTTLSDSNTTYSISLDEEEMNYLLHSLSKEIGSNVDNIYIYYQEDGKYSLYMPLEWMFFKSCLVMDASITYSSSTDTIDLNISNLSLGKFGVNNFFVKNLILPNFNEEYINKLFGQINLTTETKIDGTNINVSVKSDDFINLILSKTDNSLYNVLYSTLKTDNDVSYTFTSEEIGINFELKDIKETSNTHSIESNLTSVKANMNTLLENKVVNAKNSDLVFNYLVKGYSYLTKEEKEEIESIDLSSISITSDNVKTYNGIIERNKDILSNKFIIDNLRVLDPSIVIPEEDLNKEINNQELIGTSYIFLNKECSKFSYVIVESLYTQIYADKVSVNVLLNINSFETVVTLNFSKVNGDNYLELKLESASIGSISVDNSNSDVIMNYIENGLTTKMMYVNDNNNFVIDLGVYESKEFKGALIFSYFHSVYDLEDGQVRISYKVSK